MPEQIGKLTPSRDLQAYFLTPSAIAALSSATVNSFNLSGKWRQQFDWAVVEWNRDNVFEHPVLRSLPDGDLSGLTLTYAETRTGCIPFQSNLYRPLNGIVCGFGYLTPTETTLFTTSISLVLNIRMRLLPMARRNLHLPR